LTQSLSKNLKATYSPKRTHEPMSGNLSASCCCLFVGWLVFVLFAAGGGQRLEEEEEEEETRTGEGRQQRPLLRPSGGCRHGRGGRNATQRHTPCMTRPSLSPTHVLGDGLELLLVRDGPAVPQGQGAVAPDVDDGDGGGQEVEGDGDEHDVGEGPEREEEEVGKRQEVVRPAGAHINLGDPLRAKLDLPDRLPLPVGALEGEPLGMGGGGGGVPVSLHQIWGNGLGDMRTT
jgi:hypothetical protein